MIRTIDCKIKKTIRHLLILVFCVAITINSSFLLLHAETTNHGHQTITNGRLEWEINTYDAVQDIEVNGTTFRAAGIIILNYYLTNSYKGTIRTYWTGFNSGWYNAMNVYTYGATISSVAYTGSAGITFKINNPTDRITVIMTFNNTDMNTSLQGISSFSNTTSLSTSSDPYNATLLNMDVKLSNIDSTLSDIYTAITNDNQAILSYLDEISAYADYLDDINLKLDNLDNQIDTISWVNMPINYKGATTDYVNFNTNYTTGVGYYYTFENVTINQSNEHAIFKFNIPIIGVFTPDMIKFYTRTQRGWYLLNPEIMVYRTQFEMTIYFILDNSSQNFIENQILAIFINNNRINQYRADLTYSLDYLDQSDIEYWTIRNAMYSNSIYLSLQNILSGASQSDITDEIDNVISDLNEVTEQSQTIENQQINNLDSFNNQIDLDDYNFDFNSRNGIEYFKLKLTDIYDIEEFKPFYLIPIVLFVLMALLRG